MKQYRVLSITNNVEEYPDSEADTLEFPDLISSVEDEQEFFILGVNVDECYPASEFFSMVYIKYFFVDE